MKPPKDFIKQAEAYAAEMETEAWGPEELELRKMWAYYKKLADLCYAAAQEKRGEG
jgi:hypothetical protein